MNEVNELIEKVQIEAGIEVDGQLGDAQKSKGLITLRGCRSGRCQGQRNGLIGVKT